MEIKIKTWDFTINTIDVDLPYYYEFKDYEFPNIKLCGKIDVGVETRVEIKTDDDEVTVKISKESFDMNGANLGSWFKPEHKSNKEDFNALLNKAKLFLNEL